MTHYLKSSIVSAALLLAGCATTYVSPVEVNRFMGQQPHLLGTGTITLQSAPGAQTDSLELAEYSRAVADRLAALGYTLAQGSAGDGAASQIAEISVDRLVARPERGRSPVSVGVGGSTGSYGSGVGMGIGIDLSGPPPERVNSELRVIIRSAQGGAPLWEGRAQFTASMNSDMAQASTSAERLANALFDGFPGQSGETITVK